jgi:hypothetical protein
MVFYKTFRVPITVALFFVAFVACQKKAVETSAPSNYRIKVGPTPSIVRPETQTLNQADGDQAYWIAVDDKDALDASKTLYIEFEDPYVFPESKLVTGSNPKRYRVFCSGAYCQSGAIGTSNIQYGKPYAYWQTFATLDAKAKPTDGHIIIKQGP